MSHRSRRARTLIVLALAALVALPTLALAGSAPASPSAQVAKRRCARARCRRSGRRGSSGGVPRPFNPLFNADRSLRVLVSFQQERGGKPRQVVDFRAGNVPVTCTTSGAQRVLLIMIVPLRGSSFADDQTDSSGGRKHLSGRFVSATKAVGEFKLSYPDLRGGTCNSDTMQFTATR
jgi:hypothetical protein